MKWIEWSLCLLLGALAITDSKNKEIPIWSIVPVLCIGILNLHLQHYRDWKSILGGISVGVTLCLLSKATNSRIGMGDGFVIAEIGMFMGAKLTFFCMSAAFFLASFAALFLLCRKKAGKNYKMPFIPYIFAAYTIIICMQRGGKG